MTVLYTKSGQSIIMHHAIDVLDAVNTGNYYLENPVKPKVDMPKVNNEPKVESKKESRAEPKFSSRKYSIESSDSKDKSSDVKE